MNRLFGTCGAPASAAHWREFSDKLARHFDDFPALAPKLPENVDRLATLERDGIVFIDNLFDEAEMARLKAGLAGPMAAIRNDMPEALGLELDYLDLSPALGRYRVYRIDRLVEETHKFRDHPVLHDLVDAYLSGKTHWVDLALEQRRAPPDWDAAVGDLIPHADHIFRELKIYLAIEDITDDNGPIVYWTGTHRRGAWRMLPDYLASIGGVWADSSNIVNHNTVRNLLARSPEFAGCVEVRCNIKAGAAFICDTRGLHRASYLNAGERWHIYSTYALQGYVRRWVPNANWLQPLDLS